MQPITITQTEHGYYTVEQGGRACTYLGWGEMIEQIVTMTFNRQRSIDGYGMKTPEEQRAYDAWYIQPEESECDDWSSVEAHIPF